jgi:hypothetical protein
MHEILSQYTRTVLEQTTKDFQIFQEKIGGRISMKLQSEILSALMQGAFEDIVPNTRGGAGDHEADVYINDVPLEIKTSYNSREWRGGAYSKRSGHFLLVSWKLSTTSEPTWCAMHVVLSENDWKSSGSANYYATSISLDDALAKQGRVLVGNVKKATSRMHPIYEHIV